MVKRALIINIAILFGLLSCNSRKSIFLSKEIEVLSCTKQTLHPGMQGAPSNVSFHVTAVLNSKNIESFNNVYIYSVKENKAINNSGLKVFKNKKPLKTNIYNTGDTLSFYSSYSIFSEVGLVFEENCPIENKEKAELIIEFTNKGKKKLLGIKDIKELETIYAP